ncbi:MAG: hypothetical protein QNJ34_25010 [Xenococcaceae cyanobacterium MO_188.B29]|nr:hypothetical protein [Xenococcaceae cyanobacterium MO_188.B29]
MKRKITLFLTPLWQYLNQPLLDNKSVWDLNFFWYLYKVQLLRKCWDKECLPKGSTHPQ